MKQEIVPTSPKYAKKNKDETKVINKVRISFFEYLLLIIFCLLGGFVSFIIFHNFSSVIPTLPQEIVYLQSKKSEQISFNDAIQKIESSIVSVVPKNTEDILSRGVALTSDGWVITVLPEGTYAADELEIISANNKLREVTGLIYDEYSKTYFLKTTGQEDLKPAQFVDPEQNAISDNVLAVTSSLYSGSRVDLTNLENLTFNESNEFNVSQKPYSYLIADNFRQEYFGSPLVNVSGDVIGLNLLDNLVLPHQYFTDVMPQVISEQKIERLSLDLKYSDLSRAINSQEEKGALIISANKPLLEDDNVLKIDNTDIDKTHNLTNILQEYKPGDVAIFTILRSKEKQEVEITL